MSDKEENIPEHPTTADEAHESGDLESSHESGAGESHSGQEKLEIHYDPKAKPAKGILKKPGEEGSHKSESHIHITQEDDGQIHDAEKKKAPKKPMPVEGRTGVITPTGKKGSIGAKDAKKPEIPATEEAPQKPAEEHPKKDKKHKEKGEMSEKDKENCIIS